MNSITGLVLVVGQGDEMEVVGDPDIGLLQRRREGEHRGGVDEVAALDGDDLAGGDRFDGEESPAGDRALATLAGLGRDPRRDDRPSIVGRAHGGRP